MPETNVKDLYANNKPESSNDLFLKLKDGDNFRVRILGIPAVFDSTYTDPKTNESKISTKYAWPVYNHDLKKSQVLQGGATIYNSLNSLIQDEDWGDPSEYDVKISRTGSGMNDTKYTVSPSPKSLDLPEDVELKDVLSISQKSPFNENVHMLGDMVMPVTKDVVLEDIDDEPIDLSTIPL